MPPSYLAAAVLVLAVVAISYQGRGPAAHVAQIAVVLVVVIGVFTALIFAFLGVITAAWAGQFYYGQC